MSLYYLVSKDCSVTIYNMSKSGSDISERLVRYKEYEKKNKFDYILLNFGGNDTLNSLKIGLENMIVYFQENTNTKVVILNEAIFNNLQSEELKIIESASKKYNVEFLDLSGFLKRKTDQDVGELWADFIHFSQFGHDEVSSWLTSKLSGKIRSHCKLNR